MPAESADWGPHLLTTAQPPIERLRLALIDHGLGRMTAENWAELVQEIVADVPLSIYFR